ncbi:MAG: hypothetical protein PHW96_00195 [Candidatus Nanoarchaeia archaeon]|nr:hypothetical protein [Candidatus Nanoarchaeia archaeon]
MNIRLFPGKIREWLYEQSQWSYWKRNTAFVFLIINLVLSVGTYVNYYNVAVDLNSIIPILFAYCAFSELIAVIGLFFYLIKNQKHTGEFFILISVPWLMFFGFIAAIVPFLSGLAMDTGFFLGIVYHAFMFVEAFVLIKLVDGKDIMFPLLLGASLLVMYMIISKDFWRLALLLFFSYS